jgi:hypothetical protein
MAHEKSTLPYEYSGSCACGRVSISISLPDRLDTYAPRACDCDFCVDRSISYLSDPGGSLEIRSDLPLKPLTQGSEQAKFLSCTACGSVFAVIGTFNSGLKGAVNAGFLNDRNQLQKSVSVSPRLLSPAQKIERWEKLWSRVKVMEVLRQPT